MSKTVKKLSFVVEHIDEAVHIRHALKQRPMPFNELRQIIIDKNVSKQYADQIIRQAISSGFIERKNDLLHITKMFE